MAQRYAAMRREDLAMSERSDLGLANALYLATGHFPIQTAAKERMRWLSVQLATAQSKLAALRNEGAAEGDCVLVPREPTEAMLRAAEEVLPAFNLHPPEGRIGTYDELTGAIYRTMIAAAPASPADGGGGEDAEEAAYQIGKREGYEEAIQDIDRLTGGDGEYRFCTNLDPERHVPDAATMKANIAERFAALASRPAADISTDGPYEIDEHRRWLARQLLDSKLSDDAAYSTVAYSPAIKVARPAVEEKLVEALKVVRPVLESLDEVGEDTPENIRKALEAVWAAIGSEEPC